MQRRHILFAAFVSAVCLAGYMIPAKVSALKGASVISAASGPVTQGSLNVVNPEGQPLGQCPLKHTDVKAQISGFISRVTVTQEFENPFKEKIEAVYTFPLPQAAAVDDMTMLVGERTVRGRVKRREEAQAIYEAARAAGHVASLLDQERPNIFTQSVANIMPGEQVKVTISYVETLKYEDGSYEFTFPMVVGPRYIPGQPQGKTGGGRAADTARVPDASRITPAVARHGTRAGQDISIEVALDAGLPIDGLTSALHEVEVERPTARNALVRLKNKGEIPNKDFILRYDVSGRRIEDALLAHRSDKGGFFSLILSPPDRVTAEDVTPRELVFVLDTSGSMEGFPIEKAKETMRLALDALYPEDTFNLITFAGNTSILFDKPVPATSENLRRAKAFLASRSGSGGTEMMRAIRAALEPSDEQDHIRVVCFMTDGYVGNDFEIISEVQKHLNARVFSFGIGQSVNRFLLDKMAEHGRGEVEYVTLSDDGSRAARRFAERVRNPLLTDISIDWAGLPVVDVYPARIPDLFGAKPVVLSGRYTGGGRGVIRLKGKMAGRDFTREIALTLPEAEPRNDVLQSLWARARIDELMSRDYNGLQQGNPPDEVREAITQIGLEFRLMTQFTSFVAVEEMIVTEGGEPRRVEVPVDMAEGVSHKGVFGEAIGGVAGSLRLQAGLGAATETVTVSAGESPVEREKSQISSTVTPGNPAWPNPPAPPSHNRRSDVRPRAMSPEEQKQQRLRAKLHPQVAAVVERPGSNIAQLSAGEAKFVRNGKADVQVWLTDKSAAVIERLKQIGFEVTLDPKTAKMIIGRIAVEKLLALAEIESVRYVAPAPPIN